MSKVQSSQPQPRIVSRRQFIKYSTATVAAFGVAPAFVSGQNLNSKIRVAGIGVGGKGSTDTDNCAANGAELVALCDVDMNTLNARGEKYPKAQKFQDFRKMLEKIGKEIDAVTVSTPDHTHALASMLAMKMGKHVYCQKPLTHSVYEARLLRKTAKEMKVATQMGNQGSAEDGLRRAVEILQAGLIGNPKELHVWSNRPIWPQGLARPEGEDPVPAHLDWDLWIGPAPMRPYKEGAATTDKEGKKRRGSGVYHPFAWRGWRDFGTGALGDMACHTVNMPFRALKLGYPSVVECEETSELFPETYPKTSRIRFEFPKREGLPPLKFWWYDGNPKDASQKPLRPHPDIVSDIVASKGSLPSSGALIIGDKGKVFSADDYGKSFDVMLNGEAKFSPGADHEACKVVPVTIPRNSGSESTDHRQKAEWMRMIQGGAPAYSNFDIAAYLTEIILLGCVAMNVGVGKRLDWDGPKMKATNTKEAEKYVKFQYRKGWELPT